MPGCTHGMESGPQRGDGKKRTDGMAKYSSSTGEREVAGVRSGQIVQMRRGDCISLASAVLDVFSTDTKFISWR